MFKSTFELYPGIHPDCKPKHEPGKPASQTSKVACLNSHLRILRYMELCTRIVVWILETFKAWTKPKLGNSFRFQLHLLKKRDNLTLISNVFNLNAVKTWANNFMSSCNKTTLMWKYVYGFSSRLVWETQVSREIAVTIFKTSKNTPYLSVILFRFPDQEVNHGMR